MLIVADETKEEREERAKRAKKNLSSVELSNSNNDEEEKSETSPTETVNGRPKKPPKEKKVVVKKIDKLRQENLNKKSSEKEVKMKEKFTNLTKDLNVTKSKVFLVIELWVILLGSNCKHWEIDWRFCKWLQETRTLWSFYHCSLILNWLSWRLLSSGTPILEFQNLRQVAEPLAFNWTWQIPTKATREGCKSLCEIGIHWYINWVIFD